MLGDLKIFLSSTQVDLAKYGKILSDSLAF